MVRVLPTLYRISFIYCLPCLQKCKLHESRDSPIHCCKPSAYHVSDVGKLPMCICFINEWAPWEYSLPFMFLSFLLPDAMLCSGNVYSWTNKPIITHGLKALRGEERKSRCTPHWSELGGLFAVKQLWGPSIRCLWVIVIAHHLSASPSHCFSCTAHRPFLPCCFSD